MAPAVARCLREPPEVQARRVAWERLSFAEQQDALFEETEGLTPLPQQLVTVTREDWERRWRESQQRCRDLEAWLERPS